MKKVVFLMMALASFAFAGDGEMLRSYSFAGDGEMLRSYSVLAAAVGLGLAALGGAIGMGNTASATISGTARNPGVGSKLTTTMFVALAMIEAQVIYALVIALIVLYANPMF